MTSSQLPGSDPTGLAEQLAVDSRRLLDQRLSSLEKPAPIWSVRPEFSLLAALALLPEWTDALAVEVGLVHRDGVQGLIHDLRDRGLSDQRVGLTRSGRRCRIFWLRAGIRPEVGRFLRLRHGSAMVEQLRLLASGVRINAEFGGPALDAWLTLAEGYVEQGAGLDLVGRVQELVGAGEIPAAVLLTGAAGVLGDVLGPPLSDAARRAKWRIERAQRRDRDGRLLRFYVMRPELRRAFDDLLLPHRTSEASWAIHLMGAAGVGKTMVIRELAARDTYSLARVDFDNLDPRYPEQRPGELVLALLGELLGYAGEAGDEARLNLQETVDLLHAEMSRSDPVVATVDRLREEMTNTFAAFLNTLPAPQVLVLDTCEELAKLYAPGAPAPAIDRTFELLEGLHRRCPGLRAVFAGRRWLVPPPPGDSRSSAEPRLLPRDYLRVIAVGNFDRETAERYLTVRGLTDDQLLAAVLTVVGARGSGRYNPFELNAYAEWVASEPTLAPEALLNGNDPYVERRILGRLDVPEVREALPAAVAFGHFDAELIGPALTRIAVDVPTAFRGLAAQEWVNVRSVDADGLPHVIEIDSHLLDRLRAAVLTERPVDLAQLGADAAGIIDAAPSLGVLPRETVEAAVRMLPPDAAATMWAWLDDRLLAERQWGWGYEVAVHAGAAEELRARRVPRTLTILSSIYATEAVAQRRNGRLESVQGLWEQVGRYAYLHPDPTMRGSLSRRARLGVTAAGGVTPPHVLFDAILSGPPDAVVAAAEGRVARVEALVPFEATLGSIAERYANEPLGVAAALVRATAALQRDDAGPSAIELADIAVDMERRLPGDAVSSFADWEPAPGWRHRCRLVRLLAGAPYPQISKELRDAWFDDARVMADDPDAQALLSALLLVDALSGDLTPERHFQALQLVATPRPRFSRQWLHRRVPPLVVAVAETHEWTRTTNEVLAALQSQELAAVAGVDDPETVDACQLARLRLARRFRDLSIAGDATELARSAVPLVRAEAWLLLTLYQGQRPATPAEAGSYYGWWRCMSESGADSEIGPPPEHETGIPEISCRATVAEYTSAAAWREMPLYGTDLLWAHLRADHYRRSVGDSRAGLPEGIREGTTLMEAAEVVALRDPALGLALLKAAASLLRNDRRYEVSRRLGLAIRAWILVGLAALRANRPAEAEAAQREIAQAALRVWELEEEERERERVRRELEEGLPPSQSTPPTAPGQRELVERLLRLFPGWELRWQNLYGPPTSAVRLPSPELPGGRAFDDERPVVETSPIHGSRPGCMFSLVRFIAYGTALILLARLLPGTAMWIGGVVVAVLLAGVFAARPLRSLRMVRVDVTYGSARPGLGLALRLPDRWPTLIALTVGRDDWPRDWERELSVGVRAERIASLLWYRAMPGEIPKLQGLWTRGIYGGPTRLAPPGTWTYPGEVLPAHQYRVVHLVGTPITTSAGLQWRIRDDLATPATIGTNRSGEALISVAAVARQAVVVVLQADPAPTARPLGELRGRFVVSARTAIDAGAGVVFVLPPMPAADGAAVVRMIWGNLDRSQDVSERAMFRLLRGLKQFVGSEGPLELSATMDVLLVLRAN